MAGNGGGGNNEDDLRELLFLGLGVLCVIGLQRVWATRVRPWLEATWGEFRAGEVADLPLVGSVDQADVIGVLALVVPVVVALSVLRARAKRRRQQRAQAQVEARDGGGPRV